MKQKDRAIGIKPDLDTIQFLKRVAKMSGRTIHDVVDIILAVELVKLDETLSQVADIKIKINSKKKRVSK